VPNRTIEEQVIGTPVANGGSDLLATADGIDGAVVLRAVLPDVSIVLDGHIAKSYLSE
jgi:hypothetical protein